MRSQEFTGKTTQEAIDTGLAALGVTIADVHVDVLQEGAKGLFGLFGSKPARVRLTVMEDEREDDHGLSDLLGSFSLGSDKPGRKGGAKAGAAPKSAEPKAKPQRPEAKSAPRAETAPEAKTEKPEAKTEKPEAKSVPKTPVKAEPKGEKTEKIEKAEKAEQPEAAQVKEQTQEKPAEQTAAPQGAERSEAPRAAKPRQPKPRAPKAPREPAKENREPQENAPREEREYAPMVPAQPFTPTEPPVIHDENTPAGRAQRFLMDVTARMNVKVDVYVDDSREDSLYIHMIGDTLGILIGRRGETLDALQYLTSLQVNKGREGYTRVTLDTENYRAKREDSLRRLAQRMANRAQKTGRKVVLEPMNPYERRVLHTALQNHPAVTTHSEGEEPNRRVVIMLRNQPERAEKPERAAQGDKPAGSRNRRRRGRRGGKPAENAPATEATIAPEQTVDQLGEEE